MGWKKSVSLCFFCWLAYAAGGQVSGVLLDQESRDPLAGAVIQSGTITVISDEAGRFSISAVDSLVVSHFGYEAQVVAADTTFLRIYLLRRVLLMETVVVSSPFLGRSILSIPAAITKIQVEDWMVGSDFTALSALQAVPGVQVQSGAFNTHRITIRGIGTRSPFSTNRIRAFFDGIPLTGGDGETEIDDIDLSLIQSVEVVKGGKSALYGAGLGGAILLNPRQAFKKGLHGQIGLEAGLAAWFHPAITLSRAGDQSQSFAHFSKTQTEGWRENSRYNRNNWMFWHQQQWRQTKLSFLVQRRAVLAHIPSSLNLADFEAHPEKAAANWAAIEGFEDNGKWLAALKAAQSFSDQFELEAQVFYQQYEGYESRPFNILEDENRRLGAKAGLQFTQDRLKCRLGGELFLEQYQWRTFETLAGQPGDLLSHYEELRRPVQLYAQLAYDFSGGWGLEAGFSYNWLQYTVEDKALSNPQEAYAFLPNSAFFIGGKKSFGTDVHVYTALGQGFSYPSLQETLLPEGTKNTEIKPEQAVDLDVGARAYLLDHRLYLDLSLFGIWTDDLLLTVQLPDGSSFGRNAGKTQHLGAELQAQFALVPERLRFNLAATLGQYRFLEFEENGVDLSGNQLPGAPAAISTSQLDYRPTERWSCRLQHQFVGRQWLNDPNTVSYGSYHLLHFDTQYTWTFKKERRLALTFNLRNLTNRSYAPMVLTNATGFGGNAPRYYYPGQGVHGRVGVRGWF